MEKIKNYFKSSIPLGKVINYSASEIVIRLQGQLNIDTGLILIR